MCVSVCTSVCARGISATLLCSFVWVSCRSESHGSSASCKKTPPKPKNPRRGNGSDKACVIRLVVQKQTLHQTPRSPKIAEPFFPPKKFYWVSVAGRAIGLFVFSFVLFINIHMELIHRAYACPLESDLVSWVKLHPYSVVTFWKCLLKKESTFLQPVALLLGTGVCTLPRLGPHSNTK